MVPIKRDLLYKIPYVMVQPVEIASKWFFTEIGESLTHDMFHCNTLDDVSINKRSDLTQYPKLIYGFCLMRVLHYVYALQFHYPGERILISKFDFLDAYRRIALCARAITQTILVIKDIEFLCLRLSFGGAVNPSTWCAFPEAV